MKIKKKKQTRKPSTTLWMVSILSGLIIVFILALIFSQPPKAIPVSGGLMGTEVRIDSADHVVEGSDPGPYYSNPPAGGKHYANDWEAGFYTGDEPDVQVAYPEGYLVHNLEHGYIIFWYNCALSENCEVLKSQIQSVMDEFGSVKLIAFPWADMDTPLTLVSWGRILPLETIDQDIMRQFVQTNRNKAPEPNMP
ncbi:MAG: hypothetical protein CVU39_00755 [Chloroflexi bacterium HGW-Chloroflexi-10]|nr:MAG: hypothetical protein CVU39_00755 [Chloroflexi bacterium HGW-Chloroflexi-10]